jgi:ATP-binding cassette, subfamily C, bacterial LapB
MQSGMESQDGESGKAAARIDRWLSPDWRAKTLPRENPELIASAVATNLLSLALPILVLQVYDRIIPNNAGSTLVLCLVGMAAILAIDAFLSIARSYIMGWNAARIQHALSTRALACLVGCDTNTFEERSAGSYLQSLRAIDTLRGFHASQALFLWIDLPFAVVFIALIALIGGPIVFAPILILAAVAFLARWTGTALRDTLEQRTANDGRRHSFMIDALTKVGTAKALGMESLLVRRYERLQGHSASANYRAVYYSVLARSVGTMMSQVMMVAVAAAGSEMVITGALSIGSLAACTLLAGRIGSPLMRLLAIWTQYQSVGIARRQMNDIVTLPQDTTAAASDDGDDGDESADGDSAPEIRGAIAFEHVDFRYKSQPAPLFRDLDTVIEAGSVIGIIGPNTGGKSTLLHLMAGLLHPEKGRITIDGRDIRDYRPDHLHRQICYLPQRPELFEGTILENLTMFQTESRLDRAFAIAESLGLSDTIARLPEGFDTRIGSGAVDGIPVGLRQRIAVARALIAVARPRIILFDEANALLDQQSDDRIIQLLRQHKGSATIILNSLRPAVLALADHVLTLENGALRPYQAPNLPAPQIAAQQKEGAA